MEETIRGYFEGLGYEFTVGDNYTHGRKGYRLTVSWKNNQPNRLHIYNEINKFAGNISDIKTLKIILKALEI